MVKYLEISAWLAGYLLWSSCCCCCQLYTFTTAISIWLCWGWAAGMGPFSHSRPSLFPSLHTSHPEAETLLLKFLAIVWSFHQVSSWLQYFRENQAFIFHFHALSEKCGWHLRGGSPNSWQLNYASDFWPAMLPKISVSRQFKSLFLFGAFKISHMAHIAHITVHGCEQKKSCFMVALSVAAPVTCSWWSQITTVAFSPATGSEEDKDIIWPSSSLWLLVCPRDLHPVAGSGISSVFHYRRFASNPALMVSSSH